MSQPAHPTARDVVLAYHRAWTSGDVDLAMSYVSDEVACRAPGEDRIGKEDWRAYLGDFAPGLTGLVDVAQLADDEHVMLLYYPQTAATKTALAGEHFTVRDGVIVDLQLVFDRLSYAQPSAQ